MKTQDEIQKRLEKLRARYCAKHCSMVLSKKPSNCVYAYKHMPRPRQQSTPIEYEIAPREVTSLVIIQPDSPIDLCTYGSDKPETWNGDICDDNVACQCRFFKSKIDESNAINDFDKLMADDAYVLEHYKDIAALQWVLNERVYKTRLSLFSRLKIWILNKFRRQEVPKLPKYSIPLEELWNAHDENTRERSASVS